MLGTNGGLIGGTRTASALGSGVGLWTPNEQAALRRNRSWPLSGDPFYSYTSLLLSMDGANNSTTFTDSSPYGLTVTANGDAKISTAQSKFGGASAAFDGTGDYLSFANNSAFGFGTSDFTSEAWIYITGGQGSDRAITDFRSSSGNDTGTFFIDGPAGNKLAFWYGTKLGASGTALTTNTWHHVALSRQAGLFRCYLNGSLDWSATATVDFGSSRPLGIGASVAAGIVGNNAFTGYIDDLRITKGAARYTANFTPPAQAHLAYGGYNDPYFPATTLLLHMDGANNSTTFTDSSLNALTVTANGDAKISTAQSKFGGSSYLSDGSGDYLEVPSTTLLDFPTDFTIEAWIRFSTIGASTQSIVGKWNTTRAWLLYATSTSLEIALGNNGVFSSIVAKTASFSSGIWYHVAATRSGGTVRLFVDGSQIGTSGTDTGNCSGAVVTAVGINRENLSGCFNGYIDDLRITKGVARYTANFTPTSAPFPDL